MARACSACVREDDTVARLGGDEFTIILAELRQPEDAASGRARRSSRRSQQPLSIGGTSIEVVTPASASRSIPDDGTDAESLLRNADSAMYRAKEPGRNTYQLCTDEMKRRAIERLSLETRLRRAISDEQLVLHYQPQIEPRPRARSSALEALVRWNDPERGLVASVGLHSDGRGEPAHPAARRMGAPHRLRADAQQWHDARPRLIRSGGEPLRAAVPADTTSSQMRPPRPATRRGLDAGALELEITETTAMQNAETHGRGAAARCASSASRIAIDDFGTGYSSLELPEALPDRRGEDRPRVRPRSGTSDEATPPSSRPSSASRAACELRGHRRGRRDRGAARRFCARRNCDAAQGYLFSRPVSAAVLPERLTERHFDERALHLRM